MTSNHTTEPSEEDQACPVCGTFGWGSDHDPDCALNPFREVDPTDEIVRKVTEGFRADLERIMARTKPSSPSPDDRMGELDHEATAVRIAEHVAPSKPEVPHG